MSFFIEYVNKPLPIILRFFSGSSTPASSLKNFGWHPLRLHSVRDIHNHGVHFEFVLTQHAVIYKMQVRFLPIALFNNTAATDESTPPLSPSTTLSFPSCAFSSATVVSMKEAALQSCFPPQMSTTKFSEAGFRLHCGTLPGGTVLPILSLPLFDKQRWLLYLLKR